MKEIATSICLGLGDNIVARIVFDTVKHQYDSIKIAHDKNIMVMYKRNDSSYVKFLGDIGRLLFTEPPYIFDVNGNYQAVHTFSTISSIPKGAKCSNLQHLLCRGTPLDINEEYIVITTKIRSITRKEFFSVSIQLWRVLQQLSKKYKIVVVGEREIERNFEYTDMKDWVYCIYDQIISNLPADRIVDLTVPALGITAPELSKIQQDGLIMRNAKLVITLGLGGNVWLAVATANQIIGYRSHTDHDSNADLLLSHFDWFKIHKVWKDFINKLEEYQ
jgi:hypothetical protein